jgi:hypothetical protein
MPCETSYEFTACDQTGSRHGWIYGPMHVSTKEADGVVVAAELLDEMDRVCHHCGAIQHMKPGPLPRAWHNGPYRPQGE